MELKDFFVWIFAAGGNVAIASFLFEKVHFFQIMEKEKKQYFFWGVASVLGVLGWAVINFVPAEIMAMLSPIFTIVYTAFGSIFVGEIFHKTMNKK